MSKPNINVHELNCDFVFITLKNKPIFGLSWAAILTSGLDSATSYCQGNGHG